MRKYLYNLLGALILLSSLSLTVKADVKESTNTVLVSVSTSVAKSTKTVVNPFENKYTKLAKKLTPTVVFIDVAVMRYDILTEEMVNGYRLGSGVFISKRGHVLTCAHLFTNLNTKWINIVTNDGQTVVAELLYVDYVKDLALLLPWYELEDIKYIKVITRPEIEIGEEVIAIGYPMNLGLNFTPGFITGGIISVKPDQDVFWTNAIINGGNSGGPLFDIQGNLIGINVMIVTPSPFGVWSGNSLSVTLDEINSFLNKFRGF